MRPLLVALLLAACSSEPTVTLATCPARQNAAAFEVDGGVCVYGCVAGWAACGDGGACTTNILTDPENCGACGRRCLDGYRCDRVAGCTR